MSDSNTAHDSAAETDGGVANSAAQKHRQTDYLEAEVNLLSPSTPFMREHLRVVWTGFVVWALLVFGPVTLTLVAPGPMTTQLPVIGFPLHYFLVAFGAPTGSLLLAAWYARRRDQLDEKYGIEHGTPTQASGTDAGAEAAAAADGGAEQ